jgi:hypothetical protein
VTGPPLDSEIDLLGRGERVIDLDAELPDGALHLGVPEDQLNRAEVRGPPVGQRGLDPPGVAW